MTKISLATALELLRLEPEDRIFTRHKGEECSKQFTETTISELAAQAETKDIKVTQFATHWCDFDKTAPLLTIED